MRTCSVNVFLIEYKWINHLGIHIGTKAFGVSCHFTTFLRNTLQGAFFVWNPVKVKEKT